MPIPTGPSRTSRAPVTPLAATIAAITPISAAWAECSGLLMPSDRNACCNPAARVADVDNACAVWWRSSLSNNAAAAAAPKVAMVPVVCQKR